MSSKKRKTRRTRPQDMQRTADSKAAVEHSNLDGPIWYRLAKEFIENAELRRPMEAMLALSILTRYIPPHLPPFAGPGWAGFLTTEVYSYGEGYYTPGRALALLDRFFRWIHARGHIDAITLSDVLDAVDDHRFAAGYKRRRTPSGMQLSPADLDMEINACLRSQSKAFGPFYGQNPVLVAKGIDLVAGYLARNGRPGRFDALDGGAFARECIERGAGRSAGALCFLAAIFVEHLRGRYVDVDRATEVIRSLQRVAKPIEAA